MRTTSPTIKLGAGMLVAGCALSLLVHLHPEKMRAPAWVVFSAVGLFGFAGIVVIAQALRLHRLAHWLVCGFLGAMAVVPGWIAFGSGPRQCTVLSFGARSAASESVCRGAFGVGTVILLAMFVAAVRGALRARQSSGCPPSRG